MKHPVDIHVGNQIRNARIKAGMNQTQVARGLKISFQQLQKYEKGDNRVSASKLFELAQILDVTVIHFFPKASEKSAQQKTYPIHPDFASDEQAKELLENYYQTPEKQRRYLFEIAKTMASEPV